MLLKQFQNFIAQKQLFKSTDKLLLAVSGGIDSMVLLHLCLKAAFNFSVVHVNFKLRGKASDADEALVMTTCKTNQIECYAKSFDTLEYANNNKLSTQMAARNLRYQFFEALISEHHFSYLVTAHHADDNVETFFINLLRSSGIKGLTGIPLQNRNIIRPLLFAKRNEIEKYATENKIEFNNDSSNLKDDYLRNHLRHHAIPALHAAMPNANKQIIQSIQHLQSESNVLDELHSKAFEALVSTHAHGFSINKKALQNYTHAETMLFIYLKKQGFTISQVNDMLTQTKEESGRVFNAEKHSILVNRNELILSEIKQKTEQSVIIIENANQLIEEPIQLSMQLLPIKEVDYKKAKANEAYFDAEKITFPLRLRKWQTGDSMQPLGMKNKKKVSDILIDNKVDLLTKANTYVLCNNQNEIIWLIRQSVSETSKINESCKKILYISLQTK